MHYPSWSTTRVVHQLAPWCPVFQNQFSSVALCVKSFKIGAELWEEESGTEIFNGCFPYPALFQLYGCEYNHVQWSETLHSQWSEILMEILDITRQTVQLNWSVAGLCHEESQQRCMWKDWSAWPWPGSTREVRDLRGVILKDVENFSLLTAFCFHQYHKTVYTILMYERHEWKNNLLPFDKCSCADIMWWLDLVKLLHSEPLAPHLQGFLPT